MQRDGDYQHDLAQSLIEIAGVEGAIDFACQHHWEGVLAQILKHKGDIILSQRSPAGDTGSGPAPRRRGRR